jgi:hypothetical protein
MLAPKPSSVSGPDSRRQAFATERSQQLRGLIYLAFALIAFAILRFGFHRVFTPSWWRLW